MIEYYKLILQKVSFDKNLFVKEYYKSLKYLNSIEIINLFFWVESNFKELSQVLIDESTINKKRPQWPFKD